MRHTLTPSTAAGCIPAACLLRRLALAAIVAGSALLVGARPVQADDFVIGVAGPFSGPLAAAGKQMLAGAELAAQMLNKTGGINGERVAIVSADDGATSAGAQKAARELVARKVRAVIGHYNSNPTIAATAIYATHNIVVVSPTAIVGKLTDRDVWNVFRMAPRHDAQTQVVAGFLAKRFAKGSVALLHDSTPFSRALADKAGGNLKAAGLRIILREEIPADVKQARAIVARMAERIVESKADALYWTGGPGNAVALALALHRRKSQVLFAASDTLATDAMPRLARPEIIAGMYVPVATNPAEHENAAAIVGRLTTSLPALDPRHAEPAVAAYAAVQAIAAAAHANASTDSRRIADALRSGKVFATIAGPVSFTFRGDRRETLYRMHRWILADDGKSLLIAE